ncbi:MAG: ribonuclease R, partial [Ignavibacteria bacterium]|nr:ribonuclease R [Ignavibacteria bacterium]
MKPDKFSKQIIQLLENSSQNGLKAKEISRRLKIKEEQDYLLLKQNLHLLYEKGELERKGKRYKIAVSKNEVIGTLQLTRQGFGFVKSEDSDEDIFISERNIGTAFDGDKVLVELFARYRGKNPEGQVIKILQRKKNEIIGTLKSNKKIHFVIPDDKKISRDIYINPENLAGARDGDKVVVEMFEWNSVKLNPEGKIIEVFGREDDHNSKMLAIARSFNIRTTFPEEVIEESLQFSEFDIQSEIPNRLDLRSKIIFTIDPEDAKDFDDALSIEEIDSKTFLVGIHIADVSFFVNENSKLDTEALRRGTSVYMVNHVIPMLPENLSNNLCSLIPGKDRLCYSVLVKMTPQGNVKSYDIVKSVIRSSRRFTYEEVQKILDKGKGDYAQQLQQLNSIAKNLFKQRIKNGGIDFNTDEVRFVLNKEGVPLQILKKDRLDSHRLVEDFMLLANKLIAQFGSNFTDERGCPFVYRVHDVPDKNKIEELADFVKKLGYKLNHSGGVKSKSLQKLLEQVQGKPEEILVNEVMIRSMAKAEYSVNNIGHYGLAFNKYTHFTSPIRRYPDLMVHR